MPEDHHKSPSLSTKLKKLYLDAETADVYFVFGNQQLSERVPAHKNLLSIGSDVFKAMFYGEMKETGDVLIVDASVDAFKEFLSFFYFDEGKYTMENVSEIVNLGKKYNVHNCLTECETSLMDDLALLTPKNVCFGYDLAILYDLQKLKLNCELKIAAYTDDVLKSTDFGECSRTVLSHILKLDRISCSETELFHACVAWVKATTKQDEITKEMIRNKLGDLFYDIRFGTMTMEEFAALLPSYGDLFSSDEYKEIIQMIALKAYQSDIFKCQPRQVKWYGERIVECDRSDNSNSANFDLKTKETCTFSTTQPVLLRGYSFANVKTQNELRLNIVITHQSDGKKSEIIYDRNDDTMFVGYNRITPVLIKPGIKYTFQLHQTSEWHDHEYKGKCLKTVVQLESGLIVQFHDDRLGSDGKTPGGFITGLGFLPVPKDFEH